MPGVETVASTIRGASTQFILVVPIPEKSKSNSSPDWGVYTSVKSNGITSPTGGVYDIFYLLIMNTGILFW
jgi:hypothetical protein